MTEIPRFGHSPYEWGSRRAQPIRRRRMDLGCGFGCSADDDNHRKQAQDAAYDSSTDTDRLPYTYRRGPLTFGRRRGFRRRRLRCGSRRWCGRTARDGCGYEKAGETAVPTHACESSASALLDQNSIRGRESFSIGRRPGLSRSRSASANPVRKVSGRRAPWPLSPSSPDHCRPRHSPFSSTRTR